LKEEVIHIVLIQETRKKVELEGDFRKIKHPSFDGEKAEDAVA